MDRMRQSLASELPHYRTDVLWTISAIRRSDREKKKDAAIPMSPERRTVMPSFISSFRSSVILASSRKGRSSIPESTIVASEVRKSCPRVSVTLLHMAMEGGIMTDGRRLTQCAAAPFVITKSRMHIMLLERLLCVMMGTRCQVRRGTPRS